MRAIVYAKYGPPDVLELEELERPEPGDTQLLVRVRAASVNTADCIWMRGRPAIIRPLTGLFRPRRGRLGADLAGVVEAVGRGVERYRPGDEVYGQVDGETPGKPTLEFGSFAEYLCVGEDSVAPKPAGITLEEAAAVPMAGLTALQGLRDKGRLEAGQRVLINGASGGIGTFAVQIAKAWGAVVTGVCSTRNVELVRSLGADHVVDYTREDFSQVVQSQDLMLDIIGNRKPCECRRVLKEQGTYLQAGVTDDGRWLGPLKRTLWVSLANRSASQKMTSYMMKRTREDLEVLGRLIESGKVSPVIDRSYVLSEAPEALRYFEKGHARGKVVIALG